MNMHTHLTSLAPDIIEAILRGDEPNGLPRRSGAKTGLSLEKPRKNLAGAVG